MSSVDTCIYRLTSKSAGPTPETRETIATPPEKELIPKSALVMKALTNLEKENIVGCNGVSISNMQSEENLLTGCNVSSRSLSKSLVSIAHPPLYGYLGSPSLRFDSCLMKSR